MDADGTRRPARDELAVEEPLEIRIGGEPFAVTMRTPGHDFDLLVGFLLGEGVVRGTEEIAAMRYCAEEQVERSYNVIDVTVRGARARIAAAARKRSLYTTSSCGVCGLESIDAVLATVPPQRTGEELPTVVRAGVLAALPQRLRAEQRVFDSTGGLHAAGLFTPDGEPLAVREDVGRHNAVDKAIGALLQDSKLAPSTVRPWVLQVSGRASFELVQKAVMAGVDVLAAVSAPSSLAVDLADRAGVTLVGFSRDARFNVYTHGERIR